MLARVQQRITQVDSFTDRPFRGNPAAVCILDAPRDASWMRDVAREMNLSETAFVVARGAHFDLRWFTPEVEVDLCGHATLAAAHVLFEDGVLASDAIAHFETKSGRLSARRRGDWIEMDFPATRAVAADPPGGLLDALGVASPTFVAKNASDYLVELVDEREVRAVSPDMRALARTEARGVIVTARSSDPTFDFVSRFFAPRVGIDEDPVTGSAHCTLGPHWSLKLGRAELTGYQASARGGTVRTRVQGERVLLAGQAVTVLRGTLL
jgi:PhzF family phenazine biosynthesis protein